ncbi:MAG TPA: Flp pilus assembly protein CpaB [Candidatus Cybelea sp.]|jgi:pilus assembly protein CpaB|nr:Flp pilus assembly protein CpaB [Candidatus Cybelea sp.]
MNTRRTTLLIAVILAIGTGWLTLTYLSSLRPAATQQRAVLIASQEIPARERITDSMFRSEMRPVQSLEPDALAAANQAVGSLALITIPAGAQLTASKIGSNVAFALPVRLQPGMRAVSIPVDRVKGVSGMILPGDRVDVIAIPPSSAGSAPPKAVTIFRGIRVLAVGNALENAMATPSPEEQTAATVTLEVNPKQADILAWADANANLRLALRSPREPIRSQPIEELSLAGSAAPGTPLPMPVPAVGPAVPTVPMMPAPVAQAPSSPVQLIIGDQIVGPAAAK